MKKISMFSAFINPAEVLLKDNNTFKEGGDFITVKDDLIKRFTKFVGGCLVVGNVYGLCKALTIHIKNYKRNIYAPPNLFEKYSSFYSLKLCLNGCLIFLLSLLF